MKYKIALVFFALICIPSLSQSQNFSYVSQPDTVILYFDSCGTTYQEYGEILMWTFSYDGKGLLSQSLYVSTSSDPSQTLSHQRDYTYDEHDNLVKTIFYGYNETAGGTYKEEYYYTDNLLTAYLNYYCDEHNGTPPDFWRLDDSVSYHYDASRKLVETEMYSNYLSSMRLSRVRRMEYLENAQTTTTEGYTLGNHGTWTTLERSTYSYSNEGLLLSSTRAPYNDSVYHAVYSYNDNGQIAETNICKKSNGDYVPHKRVIYELNGVGLPTVVRFEGWIGDSWAETNSPKADDYFVFSDDYLKRQNYYMLRDEQVKRMEIHYCDTPMPDYAVDEHLTEQSFATLHPNPTSGQVSITGKNLKQAEILNTLGQRVATVTGQGETLQIDIAKLPAGVYFVRITDEEGRKCVKKVMKE